MLPIIILVTIGIMLILAEVVLPGGIVGFLGTVALGAGTWLAFSRYGSSAGLVVLMISAGSGILALYLAYRVLPKTRLGKKLYLSTRLAKAEPDEAAESIVGKVGTCESDLRPSGIAIFDGKRMDVVSYGDYIQAGSKVEVVENTGNRVVVTAIKE